MKRFRPITAAILLASTLQAGNASAAFMTYWFDPTGATNGTTDAIKISEYLDYTGGVYAANTYAGPADNNFTLQQYGYAGITGHDSGLTNPIFGVNAIQASFSGGGSGNLTTGSATFSGGTINLFAGGFNGTTIASFNIIGGGLQISTVTGAPNGASTLNGLATNFAANYFYKDNSGTLGADFSTINLTSDLVFGFATSNLSLINNTTTIATLRSVIQSAFPAPPNPSLPSDNVYDAQGRLVSQYSGGNGQFRLNNALPEPATLALTGLGLLMFGATVKRRQRVC